jgi:hypothetical protein
MTHSCITRVYTYATALALVCLTPSLLFASPNSWRGLIVYTDSVEAWWPGHNWYADHFTVAYQVMNDTYESSNMDTRFQIAGVIRDLTHYVGGDYCGQVADVYNPSGPLARYISLLDAYAADILILMNPEYPSCGVAGAAGATYLGPPSQHGNTHGAFWTQNFGGHVWVHEVGHVHGLEHCTGYRRSFDANGNYVY